MAAWEKSIYRRPLETCLQTTLNLPTSQQKAGVMFRISQIHMSLGQHPTASDRSQDIHIIRTRHCDDGIRPGSSPRRDFVTHSQRCGTTLSPMVRCCSMPIPPGRWQRHGAGWVWRGAAPDRSGHYHRKPSHIRPRINHLLNVYTAIWSTPVR